VAVGQNPYPYGSNEYQQWESDHESTPDHAAYPSTQSGGYGGGTAEPSQSNPYEYDLYKAQEASSFNMGKGPGSAEAQYWNDRVNKHYAAPEATSGQQGSKVDVTMAPFAGGVSLGSRGGLGAMGSIGAQGKFSPTATLLQQLEQYRLSLIRNYLARMTGGLR
jgi:hypothetical protein